ncbi:MAG: SPOR domain-containing protein [Campylobacteraceae bacterium]|jgi:DedD protein|nr:SPOR domain-containing protein [Campylobacteraceae bacterium]
MEDKIEEKNELSDILLEQQSSNKITQVKRLIVITVLLILLFILVILIMKFINKPDENTVVTYLPLTQPYEDDNDKIAVANISIDSIITTETTANATDEITVTTDIQEDTVTVTPPPVKTTKPIKTQAITQAPKSPQDNSVNIAKSGHYIQIGSFSNPPDKNFLNNIVKKGYTYNLHKTTAKSKQVTLVLVGPYKSESLARNELLEIKASIAKDAFYKKIP